MKLAELTRNKKLVAVVGLGLLAFLYIRSRSSTAATSSAIDPNAIDPATGISYGAEQQAALAGGGGGGTAGTDSSTATAAALEGLASGFTELQTAQAQDAANIQAIGDTAAQLSEAWNAVTTLGGTSPITPSDQPATTTSETTVAWYQRLASVGLFSNFGKTAAPAPTSSGATPVRSLSLVTQPVNSPTPRATAPEISAPVFVPSAPVASPTAVSSQAAAIPRGTAVAV